MLYTALNRTYCTLHWTQLVAYCIEQNLLHTALNRSYCILQWTEAVAHCIVQNLLHTALYRTCCTLHWTELVAHCIEQNLLHNALNRTCCTMHWTGLVAQCTEQDILHTTLYNLVLNGIDSDVQLHSTEWCFAASHNSRCTAFYTEWESTTLCIFSDMDLHWVRAMFSSVPWCLTLHCKPSGALPVPCGLTRTGFAFRDWVFYCWIIQPIIIENIHDILSFVECSTLHCFL